MKSEFVALKSGGCKVGSLFMNRLKRVKMAMEGSRKKRESLLNVEGTFYRFLNLLFLLLLLWISVRNWLEKNS